MVLPLAPESGRTMRGVSREAAITDYGLVLTGELNHDVESHDAPAGDPARTSRPATAQVSFDRGPGLFRFSGWVSLADVDMVAS